MDPLSLSPAGQAKLDYLGTYSQHLLPISNPAVSVSATLAPKFIEATTSLTPLIAIKQGIDDPERHSGYKEGCAMLLLDVPVETFNSDRLLRTEV